MDTIPIDAMSIKEMDHKKKWYRKVENVLFVMLAVASIVTTLIFALYVVPPSANAKLLCVAFGLLGCAIACGIVHILTETAVFSLEGTPHEFIGTVSALYVLDAFDEFDTQSLLDEFDKLRTLGALEKHRVKRSIVVTFNGSPHPNVFPFNLQWFIALEKAHDDGASILVVRERTSLAEYAGIDIPVTS